MARVVPVGPIDPELYAFAKKEAEKAERNPRYVPKNCPAERGQIIYKRVGSVVKALVFSKVLIGNFYYNVRSPIFIFYELNKALEQIESLSGFDDSGNITEPNYTRGSHLGAIDNPQAGIRQYFSEEYSHAFVHNPGDNYWSQTQTITSSDTHHVEFFRQVLNQDGDGEVELIGRFTANTGTYNSYSFSAGWRDAWDHIQIRQLASQYSTIPAAAVKGDDYFILLYRYSHIRNSGPGLVVGSGYIAESTEYDLVVNGETVDTIYSSRYEYSYTYYGSSSGGSQRQNTTTGKWIEASRWFSGAPALFPRVDGGGLGYLTSGLAGGHFADTMSAPYRTIANRFGVFIVIMDENEPVLVWIKPLNTEGDEEREKYKVRYLLRDKEGAEKRV